MIPGVRGLSNQHAEELGEKFKKAGGKLALPERGKESILLHYVSIFSIQRKHQRHHERPRLYNHTIDQICG